MGKKDKKKGKGAEKTAAKTEKKAAQKRKKDLRAKGEDDVEKLIAEIQQYDRETLEITETVCLAPPSPRSCFTMTANPDKDELILYGGEYWNGRKTSVYGDLFIYNIKRNSWTLVKAPNPPPPRCSHQAAALQQSGGQLWIFGGEFASPSQSQFYHYKDLWVFHFQTRKWEKITAAGGPSSRSGHRMVFSKKQLIVFGGFHDNTYECKYFNDVYAFNMETYQWNKLICSGTPPSPRSGCQMVALSDGRIVVFGGYSKEVVKKDVHRGVVHSDMFVLQPEKNDQTGLKWRWMPMKQSGMKPSPRSGFTVIPLPISDRAFAFGGVFDEEEDEESLNGTFYNDLYQLDLEKGCWQLVTLSGLCGGAKKKRCKVETKGEDAKLEEGGVRDGVNELRLDDNESDSQVKMYDDGIFSVTIGPQNTEKRSGDAMDAPMASAASSFTDIFRPHPRMNCGLAIKHGLLYLYGGVYEEGDKNVTLADFHSLDVRKLDRWRTIIEYNVRGQEWLDSESSDDDRDEKNVGGRGKNGDQSESESDSDVDDDDEEEKETAD